jgi:signal transduction histidine kinase
LRQGIPIKHYDTVRQRKDGSRIEVSLSISPIKDSTGKILGATKIARDITERRELERRKDDFLTIASHELKTPMSVLKGLAQLLLRYGERQNWQAVEPMLRKLDTQVDRLTGLVNELLDASTIQAGRLHYDKERVDLAALLRESVELLQPTSPAHTLLLHAPSHAWVLGDKDRLGQVVMNLISNAIKYSPHATTVEIFLTTEETTVTLTVRDYGMGIAKVHQQHIFERFYRASDEQAKKVSGLGLGLYISSEIVKRHGGHIRMHSEEGQGTTFIVSLPRSQ